MARRRIKREFRFKMDVYSPETMPLSRLAEYLHDLSVLFGEDQSVHLVRIEKSSTVPVMLVDIEAEPKVRERLQAVRQKAAGKDALRAAAQIDERLRKDNAKASIIDPSGSKLLAFPGRELNKLLEYGPFNQPGTFDGIPIRVGGEQESVPVHLEGREQIHICWAKRSLAKELAQYLFTSVVRVEGIGRWIRHRDGEWELVTFTIKDYNPLPDVSLRESINRLRLIPAKWKEMDDPLGELMHIRHGTDG